MVKGAGTVTEDRLRDLTVEEEYGSENLRAFYTIFHKETPDPIYGPYRKTHSEALLRLAQMHRNIRGDSLPISSVLRIIPDFFMSYAPKQKEKEKDRIKFTFGYDLAIEVPVGDNSYAEAVFERNKDAGFVRYKHDSATTFGEYVTDKLRIFLGRVIDVDVDVRKGTATIMLGNGDTETMRMTIPLNERIVRMKDNAIAQILGLVDDVGDDRTPDEQWSD